MAKLSVNTHWFRNMLEINKLSQRKFAAKLELNPSAVSLLLKGKRKLKIEEAGKIAKIFSVAIEEVMTNAGIPLSEPEGGLQNNIKVAGWVDGTLTVKWETPKGSKTVPSPLNEKSVSVLRCQTAGSRFDALDGALVYFRPQEKVDLECIGKLCLVELRHSRETKLRVLRRGYQSGMFNLALLNGEMAEEGVNVKSTSPVVWLKV